MINDRQEEQPKSAAAPEDGRLLDVISRHWGYSAFRPLQSEAMHAVLQGRDSLVVLPTGGGKSLCYQAPALVQEGVTVVVSPLISLMKDQVDGLAACGVAAAQLNSSLEAFDQRVIERDLTEGKLKLIFVSPERIAVPSFRKLLSTVTVNSFAIDEAHCISHWGHDFRPEYRMLRDLRGLFPRASIHAYTATATEQVRRDIVAQLALRDPVALVGSFDRPNLNYRIVPRRNEMQQVEEVLARHKGEGGIIYCIRRRDVDDLTAALKRAGHSAVAYHAGLPPEERKRAQDAFASERCDIVVATVAFGMGIDRSNVRFVLHTAMPKSIEHYQQESGRAGRDGLEAECTLLFGPGDVMSWVSIFESAGTASEEQLAVARRQLNEIESYCSRSTCRHRALVEYFGQSFDRDSCGACDVCLGDFVEVPDALILAQKIISCVVRMREPYGMNHLISVLRGENSEKIRARGHDRLSTCGILAAHAKDELRDWIGQLIAARVLEMEGGRYPVILLNHASREVLRGERVVRLLAPRETAHRSQAEGTSWAGVDRGLFDELRGWRKREAESRGIPPFVIFSDATLRQLATVRPSTPAAMRRVYGVGDAKLNEFGVPITDLIVDYAERHSLSIDLAAGPAPAPRRSELLRKSQKYSAQKHTAFEVFAAGGSIDEAAAASGRARSTTVGYLAEWIATSRPSSVSVWVPDERYAEISAAAKEIGTDSLRALRDRVGEHCAYDEIHIVVAHLEAGDP
ncbi:MAG: DNA helicase RecQ [Thermoanaerobaculia bacterium]